MVSSIVIGGVLTRCALLHSLRDLKVLHRWPFNQVKINRLYFTSLKWAIDKYMCCAEDEGKFDHKTLQPDNSRDFPLLVRSSSIKKRLVSPKTVNLKGVFQDIETNQISGNLLSILLWCSTRPYERSTQWGESNEWHSERTDRHSISLSSVVHIQHNLGKCIKSCLIVL